MPTSKPDERKPGETLAQVIQQLPEADRPGFLALIEQKYRQAGDLELLREVRAYKASLPSPPTSTPPPSNVTPMRVKPPSTEPMLALQSHC